MFKYVIEATITLGKFYAIMLDHIKQITLCQHIINRLLNHPDFVVCKPLSNYYYSVCHKKIGTKLRFDFRKSVENGKVIGYHHVEINLFPHYHYNRYKHNGKDFRPIECIKTLKQILNLIGIKETEYEELSVINIEFGLNLILNMCVKNFINGLLYSSKTKFIIPDSKHKYSKATNSNYKKIKCYAKGIHCHEKLKAFEIDINTFRFEVKSKQSSYINKLGIKYINDLLTIENYSRLMQELIKQWESVLILNLNPDLAGLTPNELQFVKDANNIEYWNDLENNSSRNKFNRYKEKYYKILIGKNNLHHQIKLQIIDKLVQLQSGANSTQPTFINTKKRQVSSAAASMINLEYAPPQQYLGYKNPGHLPTSVPPT
ncbi:hypothetical protein [Epilithonimonas caeni]|uniref:hypothetical protein n=1 Tax=Epilithonimonas caeni TaxID=365343 RepID=UPI00040FF13A|nr:hypothetical protein [Epilithonimonas caeni]